MVRYFGVFYDRGRLHKPLVALFVTIGCLLFLNAFLHNPYNGYDARDHMKYIEGLALHWRLPTRAETGQYYSPPLPYILPAFLTSIQAGLWKAAKLAQLVNAFLALGVLLYLLKICDLIRPGTVQLKITSLVLLGILPVFYRSYAMIRGEPYLAFLAVYSIHTALNIFLQKNYTAGNMLRLGAALGLAVLARQWAFFLFPPVMVFSIWAGDSRQESAVRPLMYMAGSLLIASLVGGWFYLLMLNQYGTLTAFDRKPQGASLQNLSELAAIDPSSANLFTDPVRPSLAGHLFPILYADIWGDYWGYFLVYSRNTETGQYSDGVVFQKPSPGEQPPQNIETNRYTINRYLGIVNVVGLLPSVVFLAGLVYGLLLVLAFIFRRRIGDSDRAGALLGMTAMATLIGYGWFLVRYQSLTQGGDLIKSTYLLQVFPFLALLAGLLVERVRARWLGIWPATLILLSAVFFLDLPAMITHYTHLTASPTAFIFTASTLIFISGTIILYWIHNQYHLDIVVARESSRMETPLISVCVPARNEQANIRACVESILAQSHVNFDLVVLDDRSSDDTPRILKELSGDSRLHTIAGSELPAGWAGKPHALHQAATAARGEWLCFIDADTVLAPEALAACYAKALETKADLFSIMTHQVTGTFWERLLMPLIMTALSVGFSPRKVNDPHRRDAIANGQFILIKRSVYDAVGGHERIKDQIVEDKALAENVKRNGYCLVLADGSRVARTRMYTSLPQMWEGWTKNIYLGLRDSPSMILLGVFGAFLAMVTAFFLPAWPLLGLYWFFQGGGWMAGMVIVEALALWAVLIYMRAVVVHALGIPRWYALTTPLGAGLFGALMLVSAWKVLSGRGVTWRGRKYIPPRR